MAAIETMRAVTNAVRGAKDRPGGPVIRDMALLLPAFRARVESVLAAMRAQGFDPLVWETYRSPERAAVLARQGTGITRSIHCYGLAVDVVSESKLWSAGPRFWLALRTAAEAHGLVSGAAWRRVDLPHIQGVPVRLQELVRSQTQDENIALAGRLLPERAS